MSHNELAGQAPTSSDQHLQQQEEANAIDDENVISIGPVISLDAQQQQRHIKQVGPDDSIILRVHQSQMLQGSASVERNDEFHPTRRPGKCRLVFYVTGIILVVAMIVLLVTTEWESNNSNDSSVDQNEASGPVYTIHEDDQKEECWKLVDTRERRVVVAFPNQTTIMDPRNNLEISVSATCVGWAYDLSTNLFRLTNADNALDHNKLFCLSWSTFTDIFIDECDASALEQQWRLWRDSDRLESVVLPGNCVSRGVDHLELDFCNPNSDPQRFDFGVISENDDLPMVPSATSSPTNSPVSPQIPTWNQGFDVSIPFSDPSVITYESLLLIPEFRKDEEFCIAYRQEFSNIMSFVPSCSSRQGNDHIWDYVYDTDEQVGMFRRGDDSCLALAEDNERLQLQSRCNRFEERHQWWIDTRNRLRVAALPTECIDTESSIFENEIRLTECHDDLPGFVIDPTIPRLDGLPKFLLEETTLPSDMPSSLPSTGPTRGKI